MSLRCYHILIAAALILPGAAMLLTRFVYTPFPSFLNYLVPIALCLGGVLLVAFARRN
jgi:hypothetical protein